MGSSSHWGLIVTPGQGANGDNLGKSFFLYNNGMLCVLIRIAFQKVVFYLALYTEVNFQTFVMI